MILKNRATSGASSYSVGLPAWMLGLIGMPSDFILEVEKRSRTAAGSGWERKALVTLPDNPDAHSVQIVSSASVVRGVDSTSVRGSGVRGGNIYLRGKTGLRYELGFDSNAKTFWADGIARTMALKDFLIRFESWKKDERDPGEPVVRLIFRNVNEGVNYIVSLASFTFQQPDGALDWNYQVSLQILGIKEVSPEAPGVLEVIDNLVTKYQEATLLVVGLANAVAQTMDHLGDIGASLVYELIRRPISQSVEAMNALADGSLNLWNAPRTQFVLAIEALETFSDDAREAWAKASGRYDAGLDPLDDPDREGLTLPALESEIEMLELSQGLALTTIMIDRARSPSVVRLERMTANDTEDSLESRTNVTADVLAQAFGTQGGPAADWFGMIPGAAWPGDPLPVDPLGDPMFATSGPSAAMLGAALTDDALYGIGLALDDETGDLIPEAGDSPEGVRLIRGWDNLLQGIRVRLNTIQGSNRTFPRIGVRAAVGERNTDSTTVIPSAIDSLLGDDRIRTVIPHYEGIDGDRIDATLEIKAWGSRLKIETEVP